MHPQSRESSMDRQSWLTLQIKKIIYKNEQLESNCATHAPCPYCSATQSLDSPGTLPHPCNSQVRVTNIHSSGSGSTLPKTHVQCGSKWQVTVATIKQDSHTLSVQLQDAMVAGIPAGILSHKAFAAHVQLCRSINIAGIIIHLNSQFSCIYNSMEVT
jgi:hypothetical protein